MVFGNPKRFAVECKLDEDFQIDETYSIAGEALLWIGGEKVGKFSQYNYFVRFIDMANCLNQVKYYLGTYTHKAFKGKSNNEIFELIYNNTYGDNIEELTLEEIVANSQEYMGFIRTGSDLCPGFDGFPIVFINKTPEILCLLWRYKGRDSISPVQDFCISNKEYIQVVEAFGHWIEEISGKKLDFLQKPKWMN